MSEIVSLDVDKVERLHELLCEIGDMNSALGSLFRDKFEHGYHFAFVSLNREIDSRIARTYDIMHGEPEDQ